MWAMGWALCGVDAVRSSEGCNYLQNDGSR